MPLPFEESEVGLLCWSLLFFIPSSLSLSGGPGTQLSSPKAAVGSTLRCCLGRHYTCGQSKWVMRVSSPPALVWTEGNAWDLPGEGGGDFFFPCLPAPPCPQCPLWHPGLRFLQDRVHLLYPVLSSWQGVICLVSFLLIQDKLETEKSQKPALRGALQHHLPCLLLLGLGMCHIWAWTLHLATKYGPVYVELGHKGSVLQDGRCTADPKYVTQWRVLQRRGIRSLMIVLLFLTSVS